MLLITDSQYCLHVAMAGHMEQILRPSVLRREEHTWCCEGRGNSGLSLDNAQ